MADQSEKWSAQMSRKLPILPTAVVLIAVGIMLSLGVWQLERGAAKTQMLGRYETARVTSAEVSWPTTAEGAEQSLYRRSRLLCVKVTERQSIAGRNAKGDAGIAQYAQCFLPDGSLAKVVMGWSRDPHDQGHWTGGAVRGIVAPGPRLVADPPLGGLSANALPNPSEVPNNHMSYAVQWFLFAGTALIIYAVALRRRKKS